MSEWSPWAARLWATWSLRGQAPSPSPPALGFVWTVREYLMELAVGCFYWIPEKLPGFKPCCNPLGFADAVGLQCCKGCVAD